MKIQRGHVKADGTSTLLPAGVHDMTQLDADIPPEVDKQVTELLKKMKFKETDARFRLEVFFKGGPRKTVNVRGVVAVWTNGGYLHGGGDAAVYLCPQVIDGKPCLAPIDVGVAVHDKKALCIRCKRFTSEEDLMGQIVFEVPTQRWAKILVRLFHELGCDADLSVCISPESLRAAAHAEVFGDRDLGGSAYARVQQRRQWITYPLKNIIADTAGGATLERRFQAFLEA